MGVMNHKNFSRVINPQLTKNRILWSHFIWISIHIILKIQHNNNINKKEKTEKNVQLNKSK